MSSAHEDRPAPEQPGTVLTRPDYSDGVEIPDHEGSMRSRIAVAMVGLKKRYYGKGPERAKAYVNDNHIFVVLDGGTTRNEQTLLEAGEEALVRQYRLAFQAAMTKPTTEAIEEITGRKVLSYHSQVVFDPDRSFEIFVLDDQPTT